MLLRAESVSQALVRGRQDTFLLGSRSHTTAVSKKSLQHLCGTAIQTTALRSLPRPDTGRQHSIQLLYNSGKVDKQDISPGTAKTSKAASKI